MDVLCRYLSYSEFLDIVKFKRLCLKYPGNWPDRLEMFFLKNFDSNESTNDLFLKYKAVHCGYTDTQVYNDLQILSALLVKCRCQCWTHKEDDIHLWENRQVRIGIQIETLDEMKEQADGRILYHYDVNYVGEISNDLIINTFELNGRRLCNLVKTKKSIFNYEDEHRLILCPKDSSFKVSASGLTYSEKLRNHFCGLLEEFIPNDCYIHFDSKKICDVKINPYSKDCFCRIVESDCSNNEIPYSGKSCLIG